MADNDLDQLVDIIAARVQARLDGRSSASTLAGGVCSTPDHSCSGCGHCVRRRPEAARLVVASVRARHPGDLLEALNRDLIDVDQPEKFVSMLCARVDVSSAVVRFANAGLTPPLVRRADGRLEELRESGLLLGRPEALSVTLLADAKHLP